MIAKAFDLSPNEVSDEEAHFFLLLAKLLIQCSSSTRELLGEVLSVV